MYIKYVNEYTACACERVWEWGGVICAYTDTFIINYV